MASTTELLKELPETYSREQAQQWVENVLAITPIDQVPVDPAPQLRDKKVRLPEIEAQIYAALITQFGEPGFSPTEAGKLVGDPNVTILFLWALGEKYRLGLRYGTEVTPTGVFEYKHW